MSSFTTDLTVTQLRDWVWWRLEREIAYEIGEKGSGLVVTVPAGYITNGASVPRCLWALLPSWGSYSRAAVIHDYLIDRWANGDPHPLASTREAADLVFWEAMGVCETPIALRILLYSGVRLAARLPALFPLKYPPAGL